jgi:hypothetical protein
MPAHHRCSHNALHAGELLTPVAQSNHAQLSHTSTTCRVNCHDQSPCQTGTSPAVSNPAASHYRMLWCAHGLHHRWCLAALSAAACIRIGQLLRRAHVTPSPLLPLLLLLPPPPPSCAPHGCWGGKTCTTHNTVRDECLKANSSALPPPTAPIGAAVPKLSVSGTQN